MNHQMLRDRFEAGTLKLGELSHADHVRLAWLYLAEQEIPETMIKMREGLKRFTQKHGVPEKYHETVTFAYVALIARRMRANTGDWEDFVRINPELFQPWTTLIGRYYQNETLASTNAKQHFVLPDKINPPQIR